MRCGRLRMEMDKESLSVGGYRFFTEKDAQLARAEEQKIADRL